MILSCGEALIDMLPRETEAGEMAFAPYPGGAVFNTAIALGRLGAPSAFFTGLSRDLFGEMLARALIESRVDAAYASVSDRPTTLAFVTLTEGQARYAFYDENTAGRMLQPADVPTLGPEVEAMFFGGISLVVDPCGAAYEALMTHEAQHRVVMMDPNIRPGFIRDEATYRARIERMIAMCDIVKLSDEDLHWLGGTGDIGALARDMLQRGPKLVLITRGGDGASGYSAAHEVHVESTRVTVADTVGAGDTFNAGALTALHRAGLLSKSAVAALDEEAIRAALTLGSRAAAVTVSRAGANPPWDHEM
ncbi:carbohydrate kinase family protein [Poseidonocella sedimentorum]|uniref:Fructokinase n=1 Tax=Poseidonocella sedimentorum TaxID=871652 RepID=A0A1I6E5R5_9RHOB|nr:carbohydrate kinase [Poseidonocella sedimentorum]SFR13080.1 fructokinase [Poseidonocella sedimentorum]